MANLEINISAKVRAALKSIDALQKELREAGESAETTQTKINKLGKTGSSGFKNVQRGAANAVPTLTEFNRVIQDAPFGIQGVANNITQLVGNFNNLKASAGGTRAALSSLVGAFAGPAGLLFIVSAATSLLVAFGDKLKTSKNRAKELQKQIENVNRAFDLNLKASELTEESLRLQGKSVEGILLSRQAMRVEQLKILADLIEENKKALELQITDNNRLSGLEAIESVVGEIVKKLGFELGLVKLLDKAGLKIAASYAVLFGIQADVVKQNAASVEDKQKETDLTAKIVELENKRRSILNDILKTNLEIIKTNAEGALPKKDRLSELFQQTNFDFGKAVVEPIKNSVELAKPQLANMEQLLLDFSASANAALNDQIAPIFSSLGDAIGQGLARGQSVLQSLGQGLLSVFAGFISKMGDLLIKYGALAVAKGKIDTAIAAGGPIAIGAGLAAIAVGVALKAAGAALGNAAGGGFGAVGGQGSGGGGISSSSAVSSGAVGGFSEGRVVFEISGDKLIGVLSRVSARNQRIGGGSIIG